ncbi:hypothetical protein KM043_009020 [Ampulex compressa]|nr:hypothetical protein KM043_009020 [Ampulex compressa]
MVTRRPGNVFQETSFFLFGMKLFGVFPIQCCGLKIMSYFYPIVLCTGYGILYFFVLEYAADIFEDLALFGAGMAGRKIRFFVNIPLLLMTMMSSLQNGTKLKLILEEIDAVDKDFEFFSVRVNYVRCMKKDIVRMISAILLTILFNLMDYYACWDYARTYEYAIVWTVDRFPDFLNVFVICSFGILTTKVRIRFRKINAIAARSMREITNVTNRLHERENAFRMDLQKVLYSRLCKAMALINNAYGFRFTLLLVLYLMFLCLHFNTFYTYINSKKDLVDVLINFFYAIFDVGKFVYIVRSIRVFDYQHI